MLQKTTGRNAKVVESLAVIEGLTVVDVSLKHD